MVFAVSEDGEGATATRRRRPGEAAEGKATQFQASDLQNDKVITLYYFKLL